MNLKHQNVPQCRMSKNRPGARCEAGPAGDEATLHQSSNITKRSETLLLFMTQAKQNS